MVFQRVSRSLAFAASLGLPLCSACIAPLLALTRRLRTLSCIFWRDGLAGGRARLDAEHTLTTHDFDGYSLPLSPPGHLRCPAHAVALGRARDLRRLALAQETDHGVPVDFAIFLRIV
jgi:hypothetical protein